MHEVRCDVRGCHRRSPWPDSQPHFGPSLHVPVPLNWRTVQTFVEVDGEEDPYLGMGRAMLSAAPPVIAERIERAIPSTPKRIQQVIKHICPDHEMPDTKDADS